MLYDLLPLMYDHSTAIVRLLMIVALLSRVLILYSSWICWQASDNFVSIVNNVMYVDDQILIEAQESRQAPIKWVVMFVQFQKFSGSLGSGELENKPWHSLSVLSTHVSLLQTYHMSGICIAMVSSRRPSVLLFIQSTLINRTNLPV